MQTIADKPIAIIGTGCRLPGADNCDEFWRLLVEGRSALGELPPDRMNRELQYAPERGIRTRSYSCDGGVANEQAFPPGENPLPPDIVEVSHSAHITMCNVAAAACRDAGFDPYNLPNPNVGVYIGHTPPSAGIGHVIFAQMIEQTALYLREVATLDQMPAIETDAVIREIVEAVRRPYQPGDPRMKMRANAYHAPGLISRAFRLDGPSMAFDAACASSFRALGHGIRALQRGQIDMALVGGASYCHGDTLVVFSQAQSVSTTGSRPFDENASGLVAAGGYVVLAMKTLEQAIADGDQIQAVICGLGVSSDGKGKSLWAPRQEGQIEAIHRAYGPRMGFGEVQFLEMHATSTQVGDATELAALARTAEGQFPAGVKIPIGSVKANIGHTLETAGIASLLKTVLAMKNGIVPPQINVQQPNSKIDWNSLPFYVPTQPVEWAPPATDAPRKAAVNAFGIGGLNVHIAMHEHLASASRAVSVPAQIENGRSSQQADEDAIAIIGAGAIFPGARTIDALWDTFHEGRDQKSEVPPDRWDKKLGLDPHANSNWTFPTAVGGFITDFEYDWKKHKVPPKQVASADPLQFMLLDAADQALRDAGYLDKPYDKKRTGVIVGTAFGGEFGHALSCDLRLTEFQKHLTDILQQRGVPAEQIAQACAEFEDVLLKHMPALIDETGSFTASTLASRITKTFDLMGGAVAVDAGDASTIAAIQCCADVLMAGDCDMMICAAGQRTMSIASFSAMNQTGQLSQGDPKSPFHTQATGCVPGEGVGVLILKRLSDAERDGDKIHGVIRGIGVGRADSLRDGLRSAIQRGQQAAGIAPENVAILETASSGMPEFDRDELLATIDVYGSETRTEPLQMGAVAAQMGNLGGGLGMASLLKAMGELSHVETTALAGLDAPLPELAQNAGTLVPVTSPSRIPALNEDGRMIAGINSYAQHMLAYHLLLEGPVKVPRAPKAEPQVRTETVSPAWQPPGSTRRIVRIGAASIDQLQQQAATLAGDASRAFAEAETKSFQPGDRFRMAIIAANADELQSKLTLAAKQAGNADARPLLGEKGIFVHEVPATRPMVAFLYPGQGSQYDGMLRSLVEEYAPAADALKQIDAVLARLGLPSFADLAWQENSELGEDVWRTQLSLMIADTIVHAAVDSVGLRPDRVGGHSFGELAALVAAESWTFEDAVLATSERCKSINECRNANGSLVSTNATADVAQKLCAEVGGNLFISHYNAPEQIVVGGDNPSVEQLAKALTANGFRAKVLDVPAPFHTPLMEGVKGPFGRGLEPIPLLPPRVPLLSTVTNRYVAEPADIRENLVLQMTKPVNYTDWVLRLADEGVSVFVEVGPRQVLTGLNKQILTGRDVLLIGCDHAKRNGLEQLLNVRAAVETTGALDAEWPSFQITASPIAESQPVPSASGTAIAADPPNVIRLARSPYEIGRQLGEAQAEDIRRVLQRNEELAGSMWDRLADIGDAAARPGVFFGPDGQEELRGMADGAGVDADELALHNLRLYLDTCAGGLHFAVSANANPHGSLLHGMNEDLSKGLKLQDLLTRSVQVRRPAGGIPHVLLSSAAQIGGLAGVNAHGLAVTSATLMDIAKPEKPVSGRLITMLVKEILEKATDNDSAVALIRETPLTGRWTLCISHFPTDRVCYVEYNGGGLRVLPALAKIVAANHQLMTSHTSEAFSGNLPAHSVSRRDRFHQLLGGDELANASADSVKAALRDRFDVSQGIERNTPNMHTVRRVDNQISVLMQPAERLLWVTGGPVNQSETDSFRPFDLNALLPEMNEQAVATETPAPAVSSRQPALASELTPAAVAQAYADAERSEQNTGNVCSRFVLRTVEKPLGAHTAQTLPVHGAAVILGDNDAGTALAEELGRRGVTVHVIATGDGDPATAIAAMEQCWQYGPAPHLFLLTALDADAQTSLNPAEWQGRRSTGVTVPYLVTQRWFQLLAQAGLFESASLIAATSLGGDFGISAAVRGVEGGAMCGLIKGVRLELMMAQRVENFHAGIVDFDVSQSPQQIAECLCREFAADDREIEVGYVGERRLVVRPMPQPVPAALPEVGRPIVTNVVVTGGARGITAVVAREFAKTTGAKLHLIGSSPVPEIPEDHRNIPDDQLPQVKSAIMKEALAAGEKPIDAWSRFEKAREIDRTLRSFAEQGVQAVYHACDISDRDALAQLLQQIRTDSGPIQGIIHGAGYERASRFDKKKPELVERTIAVKVDGAAALMELTADDPLVFFAAFGSVSGRFGGVGQTDYCMANDMLAKLIDWYRTYRPQTRATTFHWHAWDDVGMAVRPESKHIRELHDIQFMPSLEGTRHLLNELLAGLPEREIAVTELRSCSKQFAEMTAMQSRPTSFAKTLPLIDNIVEQTGDRELTAELRLDPVGDIFLAQHRFRERPLLPIVIGLEALAQAARQLKGPNKHVLEVRDIEILNGLKFATDDVQTARLKATDAGDVVRAELTCDLVNRKGQLLKKDRPYLNANVVLADAPQSFDRGPNPPEAEWFDVWYPEEELVIYHGPVFRHLRQVAAGENQEGWAKMVAPAAEHITGRRGADGWTMPSAILDACFFACGIFLWHILEGVVAIPAGIDKVRLGRLPHAGENCLAQLRFRDREGDRGVFDVNLFGADGSVILQVDGYRNVIVSKAPANVR